MSPPEKRTSAKNQQIEAVDGYQLMHQSGARELQFSKIPDFLIIADNAFQGKRCRFCIR
jgi:hypothetical protein